MCERDNLAVRRIGGACSEARLVAAASVPTLRSVPIDPNLLEHRNGDQTVRSREPRWVATMR